MSDISNEFETPRPDHNDDQQGKSKDSCGTSSTFNNTVGVVALAAAAYLGTTLYQYFTG